MILDTFDRLSTYLPLLDGALSVIRALQKIISHPPENGREKIDGERVFVIVQECEGKGNKAQLEAHRKYIDIQLVLSGEDIMGWKPLAECTNPIHTYNSETDIVFFTDEPQTLLPVPEKHFAIFLPEDAHAPLAGKGTVRKAIVKIAVK